MDLLRTRTYQVRARDVRAALLAPFARRFTANKTHRCSRYVLRAFTVHLFCCMTTWSLKYQTRCVPGTFHRHSSHALRAFFAEGVLN